MASTIQPDDIQAEPMIGTFALDVRRNFAAAKADIDLLQNIANTGSFTAAGSKAVTRSQQDKSRETVSPEDYGAKGDGVTDDSAAFQAAFSAVGSGGCVVVQNKSYFFTSTLTIPEARGLVGQGGPGAGSPGIGPRLIFAASVMVCVDCPGSVPSGQPPYTLRGFSITRPNGTAVVEGMIGLRIANSCYNIIDSLRIRRQWIGVKSPLGSSGLGYNFANCVFGEIAQTYLDFDAGVEFRFDSCRFGMNGGFDFASREVLRISGPNVDTINFTNCQFNQSGQKVKRLVFIDNSTDADGNVSFTGCHAEHYDQIVVRDNSTIQDSRGMYRFKLANSTFFCHNDGIAKEQIENCAGKILETTISGCNIRGKLTLSGAAQTSITGNSFLDTGVTFDACRATAAVGNTFHAGVTISGAMDGFTFIGQLTSLNYTDTSTGRRTIIPTGVTNVVAPILFSPTGGSPVQIDQHGVEFPTVAFADLAARGAAIPSNRRPSVIVTDRNGRMARWSGTEWRWVGDGLVVT